MFLVYGIKDASLAPFIWYLKAQKASNAPESGKKKNTKREAEVENPEDYNDPETPLGEKKKLSRQMAKTYKPSAVENSYVRIDLSNLFFKCMDE